jgi:hypothetical protein
MLPDTCSSTSLISQCKRNTNYKIFQMVLPSDIYYAGGNDSWIWSSIDKQVLIVVLGWLLLAKSSGPAQNAATQMGPQ